MTMYHERRPVFWAQKFTGPDSIAAFQESQGSPTVTFTAEESRGPTLTLTYPRTDKTFTLKRGEFLVEMGGNLNMEVMGDMEFHRRFEPATASEE